MGNSSYSTINVNGALTATSNNSIGSNGHTVTVKGADGASINFGDYSLTATGGSWNVTFDNLAVTKDVTLTVIHSGAGDQTPADNVQTATWSRTVTVDNVTGEVLSTTDWTVNKTTYDAVTTPVITGYYADTAEVAAQTVTQENLETTVVYKELGKVIPVDPNGNPIPDAPTPQYKNDRYYIKYLQYPTL